MAITGLEGFAYSLASVYAGLGLWALLQGAWIHYYSKPMTLQKAFHVVILAVAAVRAAFFFRPPNSEGVYFFVKMQGGDVTEYILGQLPDWLFFSAYTFLLILWADIHYTSQDKREVFRSHFRPAIWGLNVAAYLLQVVVWILAAVVWSDKRHRNVLGMVQGGMHAVAFLVTSLGFLRFGLSVKSVVVNVPFNVEVRRSKLQEIMFTAWVCTLCFLARAVAIIGAAVAAETGTTEITNFDTLTGVLFVTYYVIVEVFPAMVLLYYLRRRPPPLLRFRTNQRINSGGGGELSGAGSETEIQLDLLDVAMGGPHPTEGFAAGAAHSNASITTGTASDVGGGGSARPNTRGGAGTVAVVVPGLGTPGTPAWQQKSRSLVQSPYAPMSGLRTSIASEYVSADFGTPTRPSQRNRSVDSPPPSGLPGGSSRRGAVGDSGRRNGKSRSAKSGHDRMYLSDSARDDEDEYVPTHDQGGGDLPSDLTPLLSRRSHS